jgi:hypothetical protein
MLLVLLCSHLPRSALGARGAGRGRGPGGAALALRSPGFSGDFEFGQRFGFASCVVCCVVVVVVVVLRGGCQWLAGS